MRAIELICGVLGRAGQSGQKKRLEAAKRGVVTWHTPEFLKPRGRDKWDVEQGAAEEAASEVGKKPSQTLGFDELDA